MLAPVLAYGFDGAVACAGGYVFVGDRVLFDCPMRDEQRVLALRLLKENGVPVIGETQAEAFLKDK